jgi:hypothetical protein
VDWAIYTKAPCMQGPGSTFTVGFLPLAHSILVPSARSSTLSSSSDMWYVFVCSMGTQRGDSVPAPSELSSAQLSEACARRVHQVAGASAQH